MPAKHKKKKKKKVGKVHTKTETPLTINRLTGNRLSDIKRAPLFAAYHII